MSKRIGRGIVFMLALSVSAFAQLQIKNSAATPAVLMHITQDGLIGVGIGNTTPAQTMSVAGNLGIKGGASAFYTVLQGQTQTANLTYTLPAAVGTVGQTLKLASVSGSTGTLAWQNDNGGTSYTAGTGINIAGSVISALTTQALWNANAIQSISVVATAPTSDQVLKYNGTAWAPAADVNTTYTASTGLTLTGTVFSAQTTTALWNANALQGRSVVATAPTANQVLKYNGTAWAPAADDGGTTYTAGNDLDLVAGAFAVEPVLNFVTAITPTSSDLTLSTATSGDVVLSPVGGVGFGTAAPAANTMQLQGKSLVITNAAGTNTFTITAN